MNDSGTLDFGNLNNLYAKYNWAIDLPEVSLIEECFTPEAIFTVNGNPFAKGRSELIERRPRLKAGSHRQHWNTNLQLELRDNGEVRGRTQLMALDVVDGEPKIVMVGYYNDVIVHDGESWKFKRRELTHYFRDLH